MSGRIRVQLSRPHVVDVPLERIGVGLQLCLCGLFCPGDGSLDFRFDVGTSFHVRRSSLASCGVSAESNSVLKADAYAKTRTTSQVRCRMSALGRSRNTVPGSPALEPNFVRRISTLCRKPAFCIVLLQLRPLRLS